MLLKRSLLKEFEEDTRQTKSKRDQARSFDSHLSAIKNQHFCTGYLALIRKSAL